MKKIEILVLLLLLPVLIQAQTLQVNTNSLNYGTIFDNAPDSLSITISNNLGKDVNITDVRFYQIYGDNPFYVKDTVFTLVDGGSKTIWIIFKPLQNVFHNSEMVIINDSKRGNISVDLKGQGRYSNTYYNSTENKSEEALKTELHSLLSVGYTQLSYNDARDYMFMHMDNKMKNGQGATQNTIECVYTGRNAVGYVNRTDAQNNHNFNTEHTYPQSLFSSALPMKSDLHHLFPTDAPANSARGSYPFGVVSNPGWQNGGSLCGSGVFEPRDMQKGATARAMFYFVVRYQNYSNFLTSQESVLRQWHTDFPPSAIETRRNHDIDSLQHNRNPFVDYPQLTNRITSISTNSVAPVIESYDLVDSVIDYGHIASGANYIYNAIIVNNGNQDVNFSNFALSNSSVLSFEPGSGNDTTLLPGEALNIRISLNPVSNDSIKEQLIFDNNASGIADTISIIAYPNTTDVFDIYNEHGSITLYPNPVTDQCFIYFDYPESLLNYTIQIVNTLGEDIELPYDKNSNTISLDTKELSSGIYFIIIGKFVNEHINSQNSIDIKVLKFVK